jgi:hypothetical protein
MYDQHEREVSCHRWVARDAEQVGGGVGRLGHYPVHALAYHGCTGPVCGVDEAIRAVDRPAIVECSLR